MSCTCSADSFQAFASPTGENHLLTIQGTCECPTDGFVLSLERTSVGIAPDPDVVAFDLVENDPGTAAKVITTTRIEYLGDFDGKATRAVIRHGGTQFAVTIQYPG